MNSEHVKHIDQEKIIKELKTINDFIRWGVSRFSEAQLFYGHGTDNPWDEAISLVLYALHLPADLFSAVINTRLTKDEKQTIVSLFVKRITERIPAPYLTHQIWFSGLLFYVDQRVIIPRSSLAELIENSFEPWLAGKDVYHLLDLCTGSACIAIACAELFPMAKIDAVDISAAALEVAAINVNHHNKQAQITLIESDLFNALPSKKYDIIISNPPYVDEGDMDSLPAEYQHEPQLALAAGKDGLDLVKKILKDAPQFLSSEGLLFVEVGNSAAALIEQYPNVPFTWLDFEKGEGGVFMLTASQLNQYPF